MNKSYLKYWGKAQKNETVEGNDYHLFPYHSLDVAAVGFCLLDAVKPLACSLAPILQGIQVTVVFPVTAGDEPLMINSFKTPML